jgi:hypothetical protein
MLNGFCPSGTGQGKKKVNLELIKRCSKNYLALISKEVRRIRWEQKKKSVFLTNLILETSSQVSGENFGEKLSQLLKDCLLIKHWKVFLQKLEKEKS